MDSEKIGKWLEVAKNFTGSDFWTDIFDQSGARQMMGMNPMFQGNSEKQPGNQLPLVDMLRSSDEVIVLIDLAGAAKEDVELSVAGGVLHVRGTVKTLFPGATSLMRERPNGDFERTIQLPEGKEDPDREIRAAFHEGLLIVRIPMPPAPRRSINIE